MKIVVGDYVLNSDRYNFWITKKYQTKKKNSEEMTTKEENVTGYQSTWQDLISSFVRRGVGRSDATTMKQLLTDVQNLCKDAVMLGNAARGHEYSKDGKDDES